MSTFPTITVTDENGNESQYEIHSGVFLFTFKLPLDELTDQFNPQGDCPLVKGLGESLCITIASKELEVQGIVPDNASSKLTCAVIVRQSNLAKSQPSAEPFVVMQSLQTIVFKMPVGEDATSVITRNKGSVSLAPYYEPVEAEIAFIRLHY